VKPNLWAPRKPENLLGGWTKKMPILPGDQEPGKKKVKKERAKTQKKTKGRRRTNCEHWTNNWEDNSQPEKNWTPPEHTTEYNLRPEK